MPEYPDLELYLSALRERVTDQPLERVRLGSPFVVRTAAPPLQQTFGKKVVGLRRLGKRLIFELEGDLFIVIHLMVAGRLQWKDEAAKVPGKVGLAAFDFPNGTLLLTEASTQKRAAIHVVAGEVGLSSLDRGGLEVMQAKVGDFAERIRLENHTLKRTLTDPRLFAGIGNAYSDEILHRAQLSPVKLSKTLTDEEIARLFEATREVLSHWLELLRKEAAGKWPAQVTAFRPEMAVHGKYKEPCPVCGSKVQRIVHASNETNYCTRCQTGGKVLADRALSRLLKQDWPRTLEEMEDHLAAARVALKGP